MIVCDTKKQYRLNLDTWKSFHSIHCIHRKIDLKLRLSTEHKFNYDYIVKNYSYDGKI